MLPRILEPEVMDSTAEARDYDAMDHSAVNRVFVADFLAFWCAKGSVLDVGTGTAQIPIELCRQAPAVQVLAIDLADHMLQVGRENVARAGLSDRVELQCCDAKRMRFDDGQFAAIISNSIVHHIPEPRAVLQEAVRVVRSGGALFFRDLLRPVDEATVRELVHTYAGAANAHQQQMFGDSLRAALTLAEIRALVTELGFDLATVQQTTDRHWTWRASKT
jgi:ubiquinone/menaquinone biosynthesis C-methylase UbiE